jgi:Radical SAM superfamily
MLLIHPPVVKACEPPAGLAKLAGALSTHQVQHEMVDANLEALLFRLQSPVDALDRWSRRAVRHLPSDLQALRCGKGFDNLDLFTRTVTDINRIVQTARPHFDGTITLVNYGDSRLSPLRSADLIRAAETPGDNPLFDWFSTRLDRLLKDRPPSLIGLSVNYLSQALCAFAMAGYLKKRAPGVKIVLGGGLITSWLAGRDLRNPFEGLIDELVAGPGEGPLLSSQGIDSIKNHYRPDYAAFADNHYLAPGFILPYSASQGCYWNRCSFCPESAEGHRFRPIPFDRVTADLNALVKETRPVLVHLLDNALSPALLKHLCENPIPAPWYGFARLSEELTSLDFCLALKKAGCVMLKLGLESGDQAVLDKLNKGIDLIPASSALKNLKAAGIATYVYLLFGTPAEDLASARQTLDFIVRHNQEIGFLNLAIFNLPRFGLEAGKMETEAFYEGDLSLYRQFKHPLGWHRGKVRHFLDREFKRHPAIAAILRRDPPFFTSNHAPFFC